jgi:hypothetical protein
MQRRSKMLMRKGTGARLDMLSVLCPTVLKWGCACRQIGDRLRKRLIIDRVEDSRGGFERADSRRMRA